MHVPPFHIDDVPSRAQNIPAQTFKINPQKIVFSPAGQLSCIVLPLLRKRSGFRFFGSTPSLFSQANFFLSARLPFCQLTAPISSGQCPVSSIQLSVVSPCVCVGERKSWRAVHWAASDCHFGSNQFFWLPNAKLAGGRLTQLGRLPAPENPVKKRGGGGKQGCHNRQIGLVWYGNGIESERWIRSDDVHLSMDSPTKKNGGLNIHIFIRLGAI